MSLIRRAARIAGTAGTVAAIGVVASCGVAAAAPTHARVEVMTRAGEQQTSPSQASSFAGYLPGNGTDVATLSSTVRIPSLKCTAKTTEPLFFNVSVLGTDSNDDGVNSGVTGVFSCSGGNYVQLVADNTASSQTTVSAGDQIQISVSVSPTGDTESFDDLTSGVTASTSGAGFTPSNDQTTVQAGFNDGGKFPGFGTIPFTSTIVDGAPLPASDARFYEASSSGTHEVNSTAASPTGTFKDEFVTG